LSIKKEEFYALPSYFPSLVVTNIVPPSPMNKGTLITLPVPIVASF